LYIYLELSNFSHWIGLIIIALLEIIVDILIYIKFNGVITSCDSLYIEVDIFVFLDDLDVVEVDQREQVNEDRDTSDQEPDCLPMVHISLSNFTGNLNKNISIRSTLPILLESTSG